MKSKAAALVFSVFLAGVIVGGLAVHLFGERMFSTGASPSSTTITRDEYMSTLDRQLSLTPAQHAQISGILDHTVEEYNRIYTPTMSQIEHARQEGRQNIRAVLTPDQQTRFDAYIHQLDEQRANADHHDKK